MYYLKWGIIVFIVVLSFIAYYLQFNVQSNLKEMNVKTGLLQSWVFRPDDLNNIGKANRRYLIWCWVVILLLAIFYISIG